MYKTYMYTKKAEYLKMLSNHISTDFFNEKYPIISSPDHYQTGMS